MSIITHNMLAVNAQRQFGINTKNKAKNTEKLSSGYKINRSADDAAGLSISEKMRNQIRNLNQSTNNLEDGMGLTKTADGVLQEIHNIFHRQRELLVKAANDVNNEEDKQSIEDELIQLSEEADKIFEKTQYNGRFLFKGKEQIIDGPNVTNPTIPDSTNHTSSTYINTNVVWLPKNPSPDTSTKVETNNDSGIISRSTNFYEEETAEAVDDWGRSTYTNHNYYDVVEVTRDVTTTTTTSYEAINDSQYTQLKSPADMTGSRGYINVKNVANNLNLSCAMSQLGVKVDGQLKTYDMYNSSDISATTDSSVANKSVTTYNLGNGLSMKQTIELSGDKYNISYSVENNGTESHTLDVRLAFDTMNTSATSVKDGSTKSFTLESGFAKIPVEASSADNAVLGCIEDLYSVWDDAKVNNGDAVRGNHTGVGAWWNDKVVAAGKSVNIGSITYGPIELTADPYNKTVKVDTETDTLTHTDRTDTVTTFMPEYLMIQDGGNSGEHFPIRLYDLDTEKMKCGVPDPVSAFSASDSLQHLDRANNTISSIRSYYGAITNRMEKGIEANLNYSENLTGAESNIRDTDMAKEIVAMSKNDILQQAAQSMIAQANQQNQGILQLIQS